MEERLGQKRVGFWFENSGLRDGRGGRKIEKRHKSTGSAQRRKRTGVLRGSLASSFEKGYIAPAGGEAEVKGKLKRMSSV